MDELVHGGKVRFIGSSNFSAAQVEEADQVSTERELARFVTAQNRYSLLDREAERELIPACERLGIGLIPYFPLENGLLVLGMKDTKQGYNVTTPERVWMYWNVMTQRRGPAEVLATVEQLADRAARGFMERLGSRFGAELDRVPVLTFEALRREVAGRGPAAAEALAAVAREAEARGLDLPEQSRIITERAWELSGRSGPAIVLGFASMPYLATSLGDDADARRLEVACEEAAVAVAARHGTTIRLWRYFPGISDMSFLGQADAGAVPVIAANTPPWGTGIVWPDGPALGNIPIVNAGPWGRDYHTRLERLCIPYAFEVLPDLVGEIAQRALSS